MPVQTYKEQLASLRRHQRELKERERIRNALEAYADIRDDTMSLVKNSGMSYRDIHGKCGPHPRTLEHWANKVTSQPHLGKIRATLRIIGYDIGIVEKGQENIIKLPIGRVRP